MVYLSINNYVRDWCHITSSLYKTDTFLRRTVEAGPKGVRLRELYRCWSCENLKPKKLREVNLIPPPPPPKEKVSKVKAPSTRIRIFLNLQLFESALKSGYFWIRKQFGTVWTGESGYFWIRWRGKVESSLYRYKQIYSHMKKKNIKQTLFMIKWVRSLHFDVKLTAFSILALLDVIDLEIYRKRLSEFSTFAWGQRGIIWIYWSFLTSF